MRTEGQADVRVLYGEIGDIGAWMRLVDRVSRNFPGLETREALGEHARTVMRFIRERRALCVKENGEIVGVLLFSRKHNMICCLAVSPEHRRKGIASALVGKAISELDRERDITVSTFREEDERGIAPRALYRKFGFAEDRLTEEFGCPNQVFLLRTETARDGMGEFPR